MRRKPWFEFIDLFAGIGGTRIPFDIERGGIGGECVFTSEYEKFAVQTYNANFSDGHEVAGDIKKIDEKDIPDHDLLIAGFPCQPFSIAGVSKKKSLGRAHGFADRTQGTLFFDVARIIAHKRPTAFLLENVKNLQSHDRGRTFSTIYNTLMEELGYHVQCRVIDARHFVPQHRERILIVGFRDECGFDFDKLALPNFDGSTPTMSSILHPENGSESPEPPYTEGKLAKVSDKYVLSDKLWNYLQQYAKKHREKGNGFGFGLVDSDSVSRTLSARYYKDGSEVLVSRGRKNPRKLTPRECARLMGFDDSFVIPVSDTQAYKQFGNSVVVPVIRSVADLMKPHMKKALAVKGGVRARTKQRVAV